MLFFELYRQLDIRMFQTMSAIDPAYGSCARYVFDKDSLVLLGTDHSVRLDVLSPKVTSDRAVKYWDIENEAMLWFAEDSVEAMLVRLINDAYRLWMHLDINITEEVFYNELNTVNEYLQSYVLKIYIDESGMSIFSDGSPLTFEQAIEVIMEVDERRMDNDGLEKLINEAMFYRKVDKYEESAILLEKAVRYMDPATPIYTNTIFTLAETYYFMGNYDRATLLYYRVNFKYIQDEEDFYLHLGHALVDSKMRKYDRHLRIYYHSKVDPEYADTHRQAVAAAQGAVSEVFSEYEETCLDMGQKKYEEYRKSLPEEADDIDELLNIYEKPNEKPSGEKQIRGIKLVKPEALIEEPDMSIEEMMSIALDKLDDGEYQDAYSIYCVLCDMTLNEANQYTWIHFQLAKLYAIFGEHDSAVDELELCDPNNLSGVYKLEDYLLLYRHEYIVRDKQETDNRYSELLRARFDTYFVKNDREYNLLKKDKKLTKAYKQYEKECIADAKDILGDIISEKTLASQDSFISRIKAAVSDIVNGQF